MTLRKFCCTASVFVFVSAAYAGLAYVMFAIHIKIHAGIDWDFPLVAFVGILACVAVTLFIFWKIAEGLCTELQKRAERWRA